MHYEMSTVMEIYYASYAWKAYEKAYNDTLDIEAAYQAQLVKEFREDAQNAPLRCQTESVYLSSVFVVRSLAEGMQGDARAIGQPTQDRRTSGSVRLER